MKTRIKVALVMLCLLAMCGASSKVNAATGDVGINATNFPDAQVRKCVAKAADKNKDGVLSNKEIEKCTFVSLEGQKTKPLETLAGVEKLTSLKELQVYYVSGNYTDELSKVKKLERLSIMGQYKDKVNLSNLAIKELYFSDYLNVSKEIQIGKSVEEADFTSETLQKIDSTGLNNMIELTISGPKSLSLDFRKMPLLQHLNVITDTQMKWNFSNNAKLERVNLVSSSSTMDFSKNKKLRAIEMYLCSNLKRVILPKNGAKAQKLWCRIRYCHNFSQCNFNDAKNISNLQIPYNGFTKIDVSKCKKLTNFWSDGSTKLRKVKLAKSSCKTPKLEFSANGCKLLASCNFNDARNLKYIEVEKTNFKRLYLTKLKNLKGVYCKKCKKLKKIYIPKRVKIEVSKDKKAKVYKR